MTTYRISISDRARDRIIRNAQDVNEAIRSAVGQRLISAQRNSVAMDGSFAEYQAMIRMGRTVHGATPFKNVHLTVYFE